MVEMEQHERKAKEGHVSWDRPIEAFLTLAAYNVGPGNILRFPYICMRNGGAAFLVPYFICLFVCGMPLFLLEIAMGQSTRSSCIDCWKTYAPLLKGVGYSMVAIAAVQQFEFQCYYAWILYYLVQSFTWTLPWTTCDNTWNTPSCIPTIGNRSYGYQQFSDSTNETSFLPNLTAIVLNTNNQTDAMMRPMTAVEEYFQNHVLELSSGLEDTGGLRWQLIVAHLVGWTTLIVCLFKGIKSTGKVVWVTATVPYILITIFLVRATMLPGFGDGIKLYLTPDFQKLRNPEVWMMGFLQIFYSLGPGWGGVITVASHNKYHHNFLIEGLANPFVCCFTSFYAGFITFGAAGFLAHKSGLPVTEAMKSGPGIAFISYPELAAHLPGGSVWAVLFFLMILNVTLGTLVVMIETCLTALVDLFGLKASSYKYVLLIYALVNSVLGLIFFTRSGMYVFQFIDWYFAVLAAFFTAFCECLVVVWLYGYNRFYDDIYAMIGKRPMKNLLVPLWGVIVPFLLLMGMIWSVVTLPRPKYGSYEFPEWSSAVGWLISVSIVVPAFVYTAYKLVAISGPGFKQRLRLQLRPDDVPDTEVEMDKLTNGHIGTPDTEVEMDKLANGHIGTPDTEVEMDKLANGYTNNII